MPRQRFGGTTAPDWVYDPGTAAGDQFSSWAGLTAKVYVDRAMTALADIQDATGVTVPASLITVTDDSVPPETLGPDNDATSLWLLFDGTTEPVEWRANVHDRVDELETRVTTIDADMETQIAAAVDALVAGAPAALNTLDELAAAFGDDANFAATMVTALATKASTAQLDAAIAAEVARTSGTYVALTGAQTVTGVKDFTTDEGLKFKGVQVARVTEGPLSLRDPRVNVLGDGTNETTKVAAAITLAGVNGAVYVPAGLEVRVSQIAPLDGQTIFGEGKGSRIRRFATGSGALISVSSKSKVEIRDLALTGPAVAATAGDYGVRLVGTTDCAVRRVHISGQGGDGIGCDFSPNTRPVIQGNIVDGNFGHGIQFTASTVSPQILDNLVLNMTAGLGYVLGYTAYSSGALIRGNRARNITGVGGAFQYNFLEKSIILDNYATDCTHAHQFIDCRDLDVALCAGTGGTPTASFTASIYMQRVTKSRFYEIGHDGNTGAANYGIRLTPSVTDCWFFDIYAKRCGSHGIWNEGLRNRFFDPVAELNAGYGIALWAATDTRGSGGHFEGNTTGGMWFVNGPNRSRWRDPEVTNYAVAGANPPGIVIAANTADCRIFDPDVHDIGTGTAISINSSGTSTTRVLGRMTDDTLRIAASVTGSRPAAATAGVGGQWLDTTLNKLIVSDGTNWRDAMGAVV